MEPQKDPELQAWIGRHPSYLYDVTRDGHHLVKTRDGRVVAHDLNPAEALKIARSWE